MQMPEVELPASDLPPRVFAHQSIEPSLDATGEGKVRGVECGHQSSVGDAAIEPVRQDELQSQRPAAAIRALAPFVEPREAVQAPLRHLADGSGDTGRLQAVEARLEALVIA